METLWLLNVSCYLLHTLLSLTTLTNSFVYNQKRTINIVLVLGSFVWSDYLFVDGMISTTSFQYPTFYSTSLSTPLQTVFFYLIPHSLATHVTSTCYLWTVSPISLLSFLLLLLQKCHLEQSITYYQNCIFFCY